MPSLDDLRTQGMNFNKEAAAVEPEEAPVVEDVPVEKAAAAAPAETPEKPAEEPAADAAAPEAKVEEKAEGEDAPAAEVTAAYTPNFKFKMLDQEKEIPEDFRGFIKDEASEKRFKDIFSKVEAFDFQKQKREAAETRLGEIGGKHQALSGWVQETISMRDSDLEGFFQRVNLSDEALMKYVLNKLETAEALKNLPPHLRQEYTNSQNLKRRTAELEGELSNRTTSHQEFVTTQKQTAFDAVMVTPEVKAVAEAYDSARKPGAFAEFVIRHGSAAYDYENRDLTPQEAVTEAIAILGLQQPAAQEPSQGSKPNAPAQTPKVVVQSKPTVIPNVGNSSANSPAGRKPKDLDDLRQMSKAAQTAGGTVAG